MVAMSNTDTTPAQFLCHDADAIAARDARLRAPLVLRAAAKHYLHGTLPTGFTYNEILATCEEQIDWAVDNHRPVTAAVYRRVRRDLRPLKESA